MIRTLKKDLKATFSVIKSKSIMIGLSPSIKTVVKSINNLLKMIGKRKRNNNYGLKYFLLKIKIHSRMRKLSSKYLNKSILLKSQKEIIQQENTHCKWKTSDKE